jgi:hypothetical protein
MPEIDFIDQLRHQLVKLGCPAKQLRRLVQEVADHREDLKQAGVSEGLSKADAESRANTRLGDPFDLARNLMVTVRRSSWWGRHFLITFGFLPLLAFPLLWALFLCLELSLGFALGFGWDHKKLRAAGDNPVTFHHWAMFAHGADYIAIALVALLICWLARRSAVSFVWMLIACLICSTYALVSYTYVWQHGYSVGFTVGNTWGSYQWIRAAIPLLVTGIVYAVQRRTPQGFREKVPFSRA